MAEEWKNPYPGAGFRIVSSWVEDNSPVCREYQIKTCSWSKIVGFDIQRTVMYSYNKSQRDALFLKFIFVKKLYVSDRATVYCLLANSEYI